MKRKLLIGILVVLGIAVTIFQTLTSGILAVAIWIYLIWMVRKEQTNVSNTQMEPKIAERLLKRLKALLMIAGFSFLVFIVGTVIHNVLSGLSEREETVSFIIAFVALLVFILATVGSLIIFLKGRQKQLRDKV